VAGDRGGADVEPIDVLGRELLGDTSLDRVNPACDAGDSTVSQPTPRTERSEVGLTRDGQLALSLQESGIRIDELVRLRFETPCISNQFRRQKSCDSLAPALMVLISRSCLCPQTLGWFGALTIGFRRVLNGRKTRDSAAEIVKLDSREKHLHRRRGH